MVVRVWGGVGEVVGWTEEREVGGTDRVVVGLGVVVDMPVEGEEPMKKGVELIMVLEVGVVKLMVLLEVKGLEPCEGFVLMVLPLVDGVELMPLLMVEERPSVMEVWSLVLKRDV